MAEQYIQTEAGYTIEVERFTQWLQYMLAELVLTHQDLGDSIGRSKKTIDRYLNDPKTYFPKSESVKTDFFQKSWNFICEHSCYKTYHHIDNQVFMQIFRYYYHTLKTAEKISQEKLAEAIGVKQKTISTWKSSASNTKFSPQRQYEILNFFSKFYISGNYDYNGEIKFYDLPSSESYLGNLNRNYLFFLMQNKNILLRTDKVMQYYLQYPFCFYQLVERQIEAAYRHTLIIKKKYNRNRKIEDLTYEAFEQILNYICLFFKQKIKHQDFSMPPFDSLLYRHIYLASGQPFFSSENEKLEKYSLFVKLLEKDELKRKLFNDIHQIISATFFSPFPRHSRSLSSNHEALLELFRSCSRSTQDILLKYPDVFMDTLFPRQTAITFHSIYYHFFRRIKSLQFTDVKTQLEKVVFIGYSDFLDGKALTEKMKYFQKGCDEYLKIAQIADKHSIEFYPRACSVTEQNKGDFLRLYELAFHRLSSPMPEIIQCKLTFTKEDWLIWRLVMIGKLINPTGTINVLSKYINDADEILNDIYF